MASVNRSMESGSGARGAPAGGEPSQGTFWLNGDVLACACPECGSPMSIRLWLMLADCWRCHTSIELTEEQEQEALRLLESHGLIESSVEPAPEAPPAQPPAPEPACTNTPAPVLPQPIELIREPEPASPPAARPKKVDSAPAVAASPQLPAAPQAIAAPMAAAVPGSRSQGRRRLAAEKPGRVRSQLNEISQEGELAYWFKNSWRNLPAWLISLLFHMALLILLATVFMREEPDRPKPLVLSTEFGEGSLESGPEDEVQTEPIEFADVGAPEIEDMGTPQPVLIEEPFQLAATPGELAGELEDRFIPITGAPSGGIPMFAGRSPQVRSRIALQEGGTVASEDAVSRGLEWLARQQNSDGSWSLDGRFSNAGNHSDTAATAMALLPFLGAGQTHQQGQYRQTVQRGLDWLLANQVRSTDPRTNGSIIGRGIGRMYAHGQATIALCEAYAMTQDARIRDPAQAAIDYIVRAQHSAGGWRYHFGEPGDTSVMGWQLMALRSGQMAYLNVPSETFEKASRFLDSVQVDSQGSLYSYMPGRGASHVMTAEALLCRQYGGWAADHPALVRGSQFLLSSHLPNVQRTDIYYWYYGTQVMHHMGGSTWNRWNNTLRDILVQTQIKQGSEAGSWTPVGTFAGQGGRLYQTALSLCTLEVYYRHLPLYRTVAVDR